MKKLFSTIGILILPYFVQATELNYFSGTWDATLKKAGAEKKYVMLDCYTDWCSWCKVMDKSTFTSDSIVNELDKNFVVCHREMEKDSEGLMLSMKYHVQAFPTFLFFSADGKLIYTVVGYRQTADFYNELKKAENPKTQVSYPGYSTTMDPGFPDFYKKSFGTKTTRVIPKSAVVNSFLDKQEELTSEVAWSIIARFTVNEKYSNSVLDNSERLRELYGSDQVDQKVISIINARVDSAGVHNDEAALQAALTALDKYHPGNNTWTKIYMRQNFYEENKQWSKVADQVQSIIDTCKTENISNFINGTAWDFYEKCDDVNICMRTLSWMKRITSAYPEYPSMDTYACLLYKTGYYSEAKATAMKAIELGKASGDKTDSTEKLLVDIEAKLK